MLFSILLIGFGIIYFLAICLCPFWLHLCLPIYWNGQSVFVEQTQITSNFECHSSTRRFHRFIIFLGVVLLPSLWNQAVTFIQDLPSMFNLLNAWLQALPEHYPELVDYATLDSIVNTAKSNILSMGESLLTLSINSIISLVGLGIYTFLVPLMVFFLLKDKIVLMRSFSKVLPQNRRLATRVWFEMQQQIANYIRGKFLEILIVGVVTYIIFLFFDLRYPLLLSVAVGISVLVPYIGAVLVSIPVMLIALFQFGLSPDFYYLMLAFIISQLLDGNLLVPFLFSGSSKSTPSDNYYCRTHLWWFMGLLGSVFCDSFSDFG